MKKIHLNEKKRERITGYIFVLPAVIYMIGLIGYPIVYNFMISMQEVTVKTIASSDRDFIWFDNYIAIFKEDTMIQVIKNTLVYTVGCLTIQFSLGLLLALFFCKKFLFSQYVRGFIVISWMLPVTVTAMVFRFMFTETGVVNTVLLQLGLIDSAIGWLYIGSTSMIALIIANSWVGIPFNMLLLTTGLTGISQEIYEAASIDGATMMQRFFKITIPLLKPTMMSVLILGFVYTFKVFDLVFVMTNGGPLSATEMLSTYSYKLSFTFFEFGEGAAAANVLFAFLFVIALFYLKTVSKEEVI